MPSANTEDDDGAGGLRLRIDGGARGDDCRRTDPLAILAALDYDPINEPEDAQ